MQTCSKTCLELEKFCDVKLPSSLLAMVLLALLLADLEAVSAVLVLDMVALEAAVVVVLVLVVLSFTLVVVLVVVTLLVEAFGAGTGDCLAMADCSAATAAVLAGGGGDEG